MRIDADKKSQNNAKAFSKPSVLASSIKRIRGWVVCVHERFFERDERIAFPITASTLPKGVQIGMSIAICASDGSGRETAAEFLRAQGVFVRTFQVFNQISLDHYDGCLLGKLETGDGAADIYAGMRLMDIRSGHFVWIPTAAKSEPQKCQEN